MKIDKSKLKIGLWYEDKDGNVTQIPDNMCIDRLSEEARTYHACFPLQITEHVRIIHSEREKAACKHKRKYWKKDVDLIKGYKGHTCTACGCCQVRKWWQPWGRKWDYGLSAAPLVDFNTTIGGGNQDVIMAMVNSGDYTLAEALVVFASACERCMNVLAYKYLDGSEGYAEHSAEWEKCNTKCDFCVNE